MDNRKERRFKEWNKVNIKSASYDKDIYNQMGINAFSYDISLGGARIHSEEYFPEGTIVRIHIELARTKQSITLDGEVKWIRRNDEENVFEFGVEFLHSISHTIFSLIKHLYDEGVGIPTTVA